jgi:translation initiation factor IF-3
MLYYELNYSEPLYTQINNYRKFLHRNSLLTKDKKKRNSQFLNVLERLLKIKLKEGDVKFKSADLYADIMKVGIVDHREWFLEKFESLFQ